MADLFFAAFALVFIVSRDILYPLHVIIPTWYVLAWSRLWEKSDDCFSISRKYAPTEFPDGTPDPGLVYVIMAALLTLLALHVFWSSIILKMVVKAVRDGNVKGDVRDQHFDEVMIEEVEHAAN